MICDILLGASKFGGHIGKIGHDSSKASTIVQEGSTQIESLYRGNGHWMLGNQGIGDGNQTILNHQLQYLAQQSNLNVTNNAGFDREGHVLECQGACNVGCVSGCLDNGKLGIKEQIHVQNKSSYNGAIGLNNLEFYIVSYTRMYIPAKPSTSQSQPSLVTNCK